MTDEAGVGQEKYLLAADYDSSSQAYEAHWAPVLANLTEKFVNDLPLSDVKRILDLGAATGSLLRYLLRTTRAMLVGIDRSQGMLQLGPPEAARALMDAERLAFQHKSFDVALAMFVVFHLPDPVAALREVRRALRDRGTSRSRPGATLDEDFRGFAVVDEVIGSLRSTCRGSLNGFSADALLSEPH